MSSAHVWAVCVSDTGTGGVPASTAHGGTAHVFAVRVSVRCLSCVPTGVARVDSWWAAEAARYGGRPLVVRLSALCARACVQDVDAL